MISPTIGKAACLFVAVLVLGLYALLGGMTFLLGALCLALAFLYSWRIARLKAVPVADLYCITKSIDHPGECDGTSGKVVQIPEHYSMWRCR